MAEAARHLLWPGRLVGGPAIAQYEAAFASRIGVANAISFAAGRVGLYGILRSLGVGGGDEVLLQAPTHIVVPNAIRYTGALPVYVDCELESFNMDLDEAARKVTPRTRAIVIQHTFGIPVDMDRAGALAAAHGLALIEDCVHALGSTYAGRQVGSMGQAAFFSTEETKTISTTMGGMVTTDDAELAARLRTFQHACRRPTAYRTARYLLKLAVYHALTQPTVHVLTRAMYEASGRHHGLPRPTDEAELRGERPAGYARRLGNGQAAVGLTQLDSLDANIAHRRWAAEQYSSRLAGSGLRLAMAPPIADPVCVRFPVWVPHRPAAERAVGPRAVLGTWFTSVLEEAVSPAAGGYVAGSCPRAEDAARHLVNLPTHPRVRLEDIESITSRLLASQA
jgi:dTDP-4-amino-4,6-dideoxygalactose transaminase